MKSRDESGGGGGSTVMPPLDRSKVRILLCDNDVKSSKEAFELLCKCSYQVTAVRTPRQVIDALNAEGPEIDIILAEVDLPVSKGLKMLKYLMRDIELRRIPIIMMSAQDEVSVVVKCLKLGAADYLVKPLRTNELLNLWTHMWKRRRMLGLTEKNILNSDFDMVASDPSDANTNSTTLFSDDTDDKSRRSTLPAKSTSSNREDESNNAASVDPLFNSSSEYPPDLLRSSEQIAQISSCPKKSELKFGESSAFFTYVKSSTPLSKCQRIECLDGTSAKSEHSNREGNRQTRCQPDVDIQRHKIREAWENYYSGNGFPSGDSGPHTIYTERSCTPMQSKFPHVLNPKEQLSMDLMHQSNVAQVNVSSYPALTQFPFYVSGIMNHVMMPPATRQCQSNQNDFLKHTITSTLPQYGSLSQCSPHAPMMSSYPYYPVRMCMQPENMPTTHLWPPVASSPSAEGKLVRIEEEKLRFLEEEEEEQQQRRVQSVQSLPFSLPSLEDKMPFLQMLQSVEAQSFSFTHQPYFQKLLSSIQDKHQWGERNLLNKEMELESCITHEICEASETKEDQHCNGESSNSAQEEKSCCKEENWVQFEYNNEAPPPLPTAQMNDNNYMNNKSEERRKKRKRTTRVSKKNKEEVETQRMTHITVERNRRKQMNDHLNVLRSLMPSSFVQRGDQASIIGGAIDFVKELEQHLQSLEAQKRMRSSSSSSSKSTQPQEEEEEEEEEEFMRRKSFMRNRFFISPQYTTYSSLQLGEEDDDEKEVINTQKSRMGMADIEVIVIQSHVNLKILTPRRQGQLLRAIAAFEDIRLTVLHLNVTSFDQSVLYSFNLKIEDGCEISTADDIAATVYQIFSFINSQQQQFDG